MKVPKPAQSCEVVLQDEVGEVSALAPSSWVMQSGALSMIAGI